MQAMQLREVFIQGYKSIDGQTGQSIRLDDITVLLGANGSGKSNLIAFFEMLKSMVAGINSLQAYLEREGANRLLFYGAKKTDAISFRLKFAQNNVAAYGYSLKLSFGKPDRLFARDEIITVYKDDGKSVLTQGMTPHPLGGIKHNHNERKNPWKAFTSILAGIHIYQFHDTSDTAKIKDRCFVDDAKFLRGDAGNLAAFLRMLKNHDPFSKYYQRIVRHIRQIMPQFGDFDLEPIPGNADYVRLNWTDSSDREYLFDPYQISDGSLRYMALTTLLLQPPELLPKFIVLDEPELGLHPAAISGLAGMIRTASQNTQVLLATQSTRLVDEFPADKVVVVERNEKTQASEFHRLNPEQLKEWLERYSLSELWEKNIFGGQP